MHNTKNSLAALAAATLLALLAGCDTAADYFGTDTSRKDMSQQQQFTELMQRPHINEAVKSYEKILADIRDTLRKQFKLPEWEKDPEAALSQPGCNDFPDVGAWDAGRQFLDLWIAESPITLKRWPEARSTLHAIAGKHGFKTVTLDVAHERDLTYEIVDSHGAKLMLGSSPNGNTILRIWTGCHLYPEAKQHGSPRPQPAPPAP